MKLQNLIDQLEQRCPSASAESWDNVGLLLGDPDAEISSAIVSGDLTRGAIDLAMQAGAQLIVIHHPIIFPRSKGLSAVTPAAKNGLIWSCLKKEIAVYCLHTNFDQWALPVLEAFNAQMELKPKGRFFDDSADARSSRLSKLVTFVPESHLQSVQEALWSAGAGQIGLYDRCSFSSVGEGTFRGVAGSRPFTGTPEADEQVVERRLEMVLPETVQRQVTNALKAAHPYEEVAYEFLSVSRPFESNGVIAGWGYGVFGDFSLSLSLEEVTSRVKKAFSLSTGFWWTGSDRVSQGFRRAAYVPGKASSFLESVVRSGADLWITGELGYHTASEAAARGVSVIELGHRESEVFFAPTVRKWLEEAGVNVQDVCHRNQSWIGL